MTEVENIINNADAVLTGLAKLGDGVEAEVAVS